MPFVDVEVTVQDAGMFSFRFSIATPSSHSTETIVSDLPCVIFIHSCYVSQEVFEHKCYILSTSLRLICGAMEGLVDLLERGDTHPLNLLVMSNIEWILERRADIPSLYAKIKGPVSVIYCSEDVAYPPEHAEELVNALREMQVSQVSLHQVSGPHFANVTNPQAVNKILHDAMVAYHPEVTLEALYSIELANHTRLQTPFTDCSVESHGYDPFDDFSDD